MEVKWIIQGPVSLSYGTHTLTLQANHYTTYTETFVVNSDYKTMVIDMTADKHYKYVIKHD